MFPNKLAAFTSPGAGCGTRSSPELGGPPGSCSSCPAQTPQQSRQSLRGSRESQAVQTLLGTPSPRDSSFGIATVNWDLSPTQMCQHLRLCSQGDSNPLPEHRMETPEHRGTDRQIPEQWDRQIPEQRRTDRQTPEQWDRQISEQRDTQGWKVLLPQGLLPSPGSDLNKIHCSRASITHFLAVLIITASEYVTTH